MPALYACLRPPRGAGRVDAFDGLLAVARDFSPRLHRYNRDCIVLDVAGLERLLGDPPAIGRELASQILRIADSFHGTRIARIANDGTRSARIANHGTPIVADRQEAGDDVPRVAIASTQIAAMLLSAANPGLTVATRDVASALSPLPLDVLYQVVAEMQPGGHDDQLRAAPPGESAGSASREKSAKSASRKESAKSASREQHPRCTLDRWGLATLGELAALPAGALSARLGQAGVALQRMAAGVDAGPLVPDPDVPRFLERIELEWPIDGLEPLAFVLARLLEPLSSALERAGRGAAAIRLELRLVDRTHHARMLQLPAAMRDPRVLRTLLVLDLESHPPQAAIDVITVEADPAPARVLQYSLLERARPSAETVATLMARLGALVGDPRCGQPALVDSDGPAAFEMRRFAPDESGGRASDLPDPDLPVLRRFRPPVAVRVTVERGRPRYVFVDRRGMPGGDVEQCAGPWRSSGAWWADPGRGDDGAIAAWDRDEWDVALSDGSVCRLFQARDTARWFLDGVVD
jgi:protein ImuB